MPLTSTSKFPISHTCNVVIFFLLIDLRCAQSIDSENLLVCVAFSKVSFPFS